MDVQKHSSKIHKIQTAKKRNTEENYYSRLNFGTKSLNKNCILTIYRSVFYCIFQIQRANVCDWRAVPVGVCTVCTAANKIILELSSFQHTDRVLIVNIKVMSHVPSGSGSGSAGSGGSRRWLAASITWLLVVWSQPSFISNTLAEVTHCPYFDSAHVCSGANNTNYAQQYYQACAVQVCGGHTINASTARLCRGDTFLRLFNTRGDEIAFNDNIPT